MERELKLWENLGLWALAITGMCLGAGFPTFLLLSEHGETSVLGGVVYTINGILLFSAGMGLLIFRHWLLRASKPQ